MSSTLSPKHSSFKYGMGHRRSHTCNAIAVDTSTSTGASAGLRMSTFALPDAHGSVDRSRTRSEVKQLHCVHACERKCEQRGTRRQGTAGLRGLTSTRAFRAQWSSFQSSHRTFESQREGRRTSDGLESCWLRLGVTGATETHKRMDEQPEHNTHARARTHTHTHKQQIFTWHSCACAPPPTQHHE